MTPNFSSHPFIYHSSRYNYENTPSQKSRSSIRDVLPVTGSTKDGGAGRKVE